MNTFRISATLRIGAIGLLAVLWICLPLTTSAQEHLPLIDLFEKYGNDKDVTRVELNGDILQSYDMTQYKSLVFEDVSAYQESIQRSLEKSTSGQVKKVQEVKKDGILLHAYYQLSTVQRKGKQLNRYIIYKVNKGHAAALVYIEGTLSEKELMEILYKGSSTK